LTGRADLIEAARAQSAPIQGIGRPLKVSKEEIVGLLTALELWAGRDHEADLREAKRRTQRVVDALDGLRTVRAEHVFPDHMGRPYPTVVLHVDPECGLTGAKVTEQLLQGDPPVAVMPHSDPTVVRVDVRVLSEEETDQVITRLREVLAN
jgi:seryl-tRNA(Sec) selenium transferase